MLVMNPTATLAPNPTIHVLKLNRETLRELGTPPECPGATFKCITDKCTRGCGGGSRRCDTGRAC